MPFRAAFSLRFMQLVAFYGARPGDGPLCTVHSPRSLSRQPLLDPTCHHAATVCWLFVHAYMWSKSHRWACVWALLFGVFMRIMPLPSGAWQTSRFNSPTPHSLANWTVPHPVFVSNHFAINKMLLLTKYTGCSCFQSSWTAWYFAGPVKCACWWGQTYDSHSQPIWCTPLAFLCWTGHFLKLYQTISSAVPGLAWGREPGQARPRSTLHSPTYSARTPSCPCRIRAD